MRHRRSGWAVGLAGLVAASAAVAQPAAQLDPATAAIAAQYRATARTCIQHSLTMAVRAGNRSRQALFGNTAARCGSEYVQFLTVHGEPARQANADLQALINAEIDAALAAKR
jgi:hypothetical protein